MIHCTKCGRLHLGSAYCVSCGTYYGKQGVLRCSKGHIVSALDSFCGDCGEDLSQHPPISSRWRAIRWLFGL